MHHLSICHTHSSLSLTPPSVSRGPATTTTMFVFDVAAQSEDVKKNATIIKNVAFTAGVMFTYFAVLRIT